MIIQGRVGPQASTSSLASATNPEMRLGNMGELITSGLHGPYYESAYRRALFSVANTSAVTSTVGTSTTYVGLALSNPIGSTVNLVLSRCSVAAIVAFTAAATIGIMTGYNSSTNVTHTTSVTPRNQFTGVGSAGQGLADSSATLPTTPVLNTVLGAALTGAITVSVQYLGIYDIGGSIILPPGAYAAVYTSTASGASGLQCSFLWEEIPV